MANILICSSDDLWIDEISRKLSQFKVTIKTAGSKEEAEKAILDESLKKVVLDYEIDDFSSFGLMKSIKLYRPGVEAYFYFSNFNQLKHLGLNKEDIDKIGFSKASEKSQFDYSDFSTKERSDEDTKELDFDKEKFESIPIESFLDGSYATIDLFIKLKSEKMIKILHKGDRFEEDRVRRYMKKSQLKELFFNAKDRYEYVQKTNKVIEKLNLLEEKDLARKVKTAESASEKYLKEIYTNGFNEESLEEGKKLCDNIYDSLRNEKKFAQLLDEFEERFKSMGHSFMVAFFSIAIAKNLDWVARKSIRLLGMGAMLHDIGKMKFPQTLDGKKYSELDESEKKIYEAHCQDGVDILKEYVFIESSIHQIVLHHHEKKSGTGYPRKLNGIKIYPLAKIVSLADKFCHFLVNSNSPGKQAVVEFKSRINEDDYEIEVITALLNCYGVLSSDKKAI